MDSRSYIPLLNPFTLFITVFRLRSFRVEPQRERRPTAILGRSSRASRDFSSLTVIFTIAFTTRDRSSILPRRSSHGTATTFPTDAPFIGVLHAICEKTARARASGSTKRIDVIRFLFTRDLIIGLCNV